MARTISLPISENTLCCAPLTDATLTSHDASELAKIFGALSDPIRLRLLSIVASEGEACSCTLEGPLERSQPTISHHTKILADAGLLISEKRGKWVWWRVNPDRLESVRRILGNA